MAQTRMDVLGYPVLTTKVAAGATVPAVNRFVDLATGLYPVVNAHGSVVRMVGVVMAPADRQGQFMSVATFGECAVVAGESIARFAKVRCGANGKVYTATDGDVIHGFALDAGYADGACRICLLPSADDTNATLDMDIITSVGTGAAQTLEHDLDRLPQGVLVLPLREHVYEEYASAERTATGSEETIAHGLSDTPTKAWIELTEVPAASEPARFESTEQTGNGSEQNVAHGLGATPTAWWVEVTEKAADASPARFVSTEQTGNGSEQNVAHGLGATPSDWWVEVTSVADAGGGVPVLVAITRGTADETNCPVTITSGCKYVVHAVLDVAAGALDVAKGTADGTNCPVTVTTGVKYRVHAVLDPTQAKLDVAPVAAGEDNLVTTVTPAGAKYRAHAILYTAPPAFTYSEGTHTPDALLITASAGVPYIAVAYAAH